jgi:hypothetical protein
MRWWSVAVLVALAGLAGCPDEGGFALSPVDDDSTDSADDDDSAKEPPAMTGDWDRYRLFISLTTEGATEGGPANASVQVWYFMGSDEICLRVLTFEASYHYGPGQSDQYFGWVDESLEFESAAISSDDCPEDWTIDLDALIEQWRWVVHPLIFVSCDQVYATPELAEIYIGPDEVWAGEWDGEWTFETYCSHVGPAAAYFHSTGATEGVWLVPARPQDVLLMGKDFETFAPADTSNVEAWLVFGFLAAHNSNKAEPGVPGLEGVYTITPAAPWDFLRED